MEQADPFWWLLRYNSKTDKLEGVPSNLNLVNLVLVIAGPMHERTLCVVLLLFQAFCCAIGFWIRYHLSTYFFWPQYNIEINTSNESVNLIRSVSCWCETIFGFEYKRIMMMHEWLQQIDESSSRTASLSSQMQFPSASKIVLISQPLHHNLWWRLIIPLSSHLRETLQTYNSINRKKNTHKHTMNRTANSVW